MLCAISFVKHIRFSFVYTNISMLSTICVCTRHFPLFLAAFFAPRPTHAHSVHTTLSPAIFLRAIRHSCKRGDREYICNIKRTQSRFRDMKRVRQEESVTEKESELGFRVQVAVCVGIFLFGPLIQRVSRRPHMLAERAPREPPKGMHVACRRHLNGSATWTGRFSLF